MKVVVIIVVRDSHDCLRPLKSVAGDSATVGTDQRIVDIRGTVS